MKPVSFVIKEPGVTRFLGSTESATISKRGNSHARRMSTILLKFSPKSQEFSFRVYKSFLFFLTSARGAALTNGRDKLSSFCLMFVSPKSFEGKSNLRTIWLLFKFNLNLHVNSFITYFIANCFNNFNSLNLYSLDDFLFIFARVIFHK